MKPEHWQAWAHPLGEAIVAGSWVTMVPTVFLLLAASVTSLKLSSLRRAWLGCLLLGMLAFLLALAGWKPPSAGWVVARPTGGAAALGLVLLAVYAGGVAFVLGRAFLGWLTIRRWTARAQPITDRRVIEAFEVAKAANAIQAPCYLLVGREVPAPVSVGWLNHRVLLPASLLAELGDAEMRDLALHEMAHIRRKDPAAFALAVVATALLWPNPFVWLAVHQLKLNAEKLADESVIEVTEEVRPYSRLLVKMAEFTTPRSTVPLAVGVNLQKSFFLQRAEALVAGMLAGGRPVRSSFAAWIGFGLGAGVALAFVPGFGDVPPPQEKPGYGAMDGDRAVPNPSERPLGESPRFGLEQASTAPEPFADTGGGGEAGEDAYYRAGWVPLKQDHPDNFFPDHRWLSDLGLDAAPRYRAYRSLYRDDGGKLSVFAWETAGGETLFLVHDRGQGPGVPGGDGRWFISPGLLDPDALEPVDPNSPREQAILGLLESWAVAATGSEQRLQTLLRNWPEMDPFGPVHAAIVMAENIDTFRQSRLGAE